MAVVEVTELLALCRAAIRRAGADAEAAEVLAEATVEAEVWGNRAVGVGHLFDYLEAFRAGRISTAARPAVRAPAAAVLDVDADAGLAQSAFALARPQFVAAAQRCGVAVLWIKNSYTCGELGYYPRRLAEQGLIGVAMANSPALMSLGGSRDAVLGTNPMAYAVPRAGLPPLVIDQASSATAYVNVRAAAQSGIAIPEGWATDAEGRPTTDAAAALGGTLLPFGGHRGGNVALLVEILATFSGGQFSSTAPPFDRGADTPGIGVCVLALDPAPFPDALSRLEEQVAALQADHGVDLPALQRHSLPTSVEIDDALLARLAADVP